MKIHYKDSTNRKTKNLETNYVIEQQNFIFDQLFIEEHDKSELYRILLDLYNTIVFDLPEMNANFKSNVFYELLCSIIDDNEYLSEELVINIITKLFLIFGFDELKMFCKPEFCQLIGGNLLKNIEKKSLELSIIRLLSLILSNSPNNSELWITYYQHIVNLLKTTYDIKSIMIIGNFVLQMAKTQPLLVSDNEINVFIRSDEPKIKIIGIELLQILVEDNILNIDILEKFNLMKFLQEESNEVLSKTLHLFNSLIIHTSGFNDYKIFLPFIKNKFSDVRNCAIKCLISFFENVNLETNIEVDFILFLVKFSSQCSYFIKIKVIYLLIILILNKDIQYINLEDDMMIKILHEILFIFQTEEYELFTPCLNAVLNICNYLKKMKKDDIISAELSSININDFDEYLDQKELISQFNSFLAH